MSEIGDLLDSSRRHRTEVVTPDLQGMCWGVMIATAVVGVTLWLLAEPANTTFEAPEFFKFGWGFFRQCALCDGHLLRFLELDIGLIATFFVLAVWTQGFRFGGAWTQLLLLACTLLGMLVPLPLIGLILVVVANIFFWIFYLVAIAVLVIVGVIVAFLVGVAILIALASG